jgi:hypothetical protein
MTCPVVRYVEHRRVDDYHRAGWLWLAAISEHAALMGWVCSCVLREPQVVEPSNA